MTRPRIEYILNKMITQRPNSDYNNQAEFFLGYAYKNLKKTKHKRIPICFYNVNAYNNRIYLM